MIKNVLVAKNPLPTHLAGPAEMKRIPNAPSRGVMLSNQRIREVIIAGCERSKRQIDELAMAAIR